MKIVIELIFIAILAASVWTGYKKGLAAGIGTLLSIIISMYVGNLLAETFLPETAKVINPFVDGYMEGSTGTIREALDDILGESQDLSIDEAVNQNPDITFELCESSYLKMGIHKHSAEKMAKMAISEYEKGDSGITSAIISIMSDSVAYSTAMIVFFSITIIILTIILNLLNLNLDFPNLQKANLIGGIASGAIIGIFFCAFVAWILKFLGLFISNDAVNGVLFGKLFMNADIMSLFLPY